MRAHLIHRMTKYVRIHLVLLEFRWRSPTCTIRERRTDLYALAVGMRIPNADDETGSKNKWRSIVEER